MHIVRDVLVCGVLACFATVAARAGDGTIHRVNEKVPNSYVVTLEPGQLATDVSRDLERRHGGKLANAMDHLGMFVMSTDNEVVAEAISRDPRVRVVQENAVLHLAGTGTCRTLASNQWALASLNSVSNGRTFSAVFGQYLSWVRLYVIDGQIDDSSSDFRSAPNYASKVREVHFSLDPNICGGGGFDPPIKLMSGVTNHGAAVASIIAGNVHGVVSQLSSIVSIVVADCAGLATDASLADGANYAIHTHTTGMPAVANVSLASTGGDDVFDNAMKSMVDNGIFVAVAAGNSGVDACSTSAARLGGSGRYAGFMAVGATNIYGSKASYSNYGACVDIWAPGGDDNAGVITASGTGVGTSFAAPAVAGAAVVIYSRYPYWTPYSVASRIRGDAKSTGSYLQLRIPDDPNCIYYVCDSLGCHYIAYY